METADSLRIKFDCKDDSELGALFNRSGSVVSFWRKNGLPASIERKAFELMKQRGIVSESAIPYCGEVHKDILTTEQEEILHALDDDPIMKLFAKDLLHLNEIDRIQAYADFKKKWLAK